MSLVDGAIVGTEPSGGYSRILANSLRRNNNQRAPKEHDGSGAVALLDDARSLRTVSKESEPAMRIAFLAQPFDNMNPPIRGGSLSMWIYYMARVCRDRGHSVTVFGNYGGRTEPKVTRHEDVDYIFTPTFVDSLVNRLGRMTSGFLRRFGPTYQPDYSTSEKWHHWGYAREIAQVLRKLNCDVVHVMNYSQFVPVIRRYNPHCKIVLHMHCEWLTQFPRKSIEPRLRLADLMIGCSEYITRTVADAFPQFAEKCVTVPNSANTVSLDLVKAGTGQRVLFVGRLSPEKGIHDLIIAFHKVLERMPEASLHLVGGAGSCPFEYLVGLSDVPYVTSLRRFYERTPSEDGKDPYLVALEELAGGELGQRIVFEGSVPHNEIERQYQQAALVVNPSLSESFGISLVEAMMHRLPVVATRVGGMQYTVDDGRTGLLVAPASPEALAEAMCALLLDRNLATQMGEEGRMRAIETFTWEQSANCLLTEYERLLHS